MLSKFQHFKTNISGISLPEKFTFPFYYEPHPLSEIASKELQEYLETQTDFEHNFGLQENQKGFVIGKMFGVLVCQDENENLGYLWGVSGKLADINLHDKFVPPVFDMLTQDSFFKQEEAILNQYNRKIEKLEQSEELATAKKILKQTELEAQFDLQRQKQRIKDLKIERDEKRASFDNLSPTAIEQLEFELSEESKKESILLKKMTKYWNLTVESRKLKVESLQAEIEKLKEERKQKSSELQQRLFAEYAFLNQEKKLKSVGEIFDNNPPAGAGECAAPKLLHYAFKHNLKPIALAEFWWGQSPKSEVRKHKQFYPACRSKCEPILAHMLHGIEMDENPLLENPAEGKEIEIVFEDDYLAAIHKPAEFLSVPGKNIQDSVYERVKKRYPNATGPLIVHRLDMSTSGLLLIAKSEEVYKKLQSQFIKRTVKKRYVALLDGIVKQPEGSINLPLRVDLDNRPNQLVCYEYGKPAETHFKVIEIKNKKTRIHFFPITGRTHQLRVHASHSLGLNCPIVGDDLYGIKANRLHLHAEEITFTHPVSKEIMTIFKEAEF
ncbi:RluA family pseudouridine synthase [Flavobacterium haoranii]|uniref:tRNA pseudouridine32 synthase / 23S rRNA pseudouridine746 synthase n=1 Tax=Flavobacterium haoranii TaxID=683124 RepID=A0A1M6HJ76_9FLAO|nr:RluA family pseudouridine synthase [Flavobacterium haoranii]SHJ22209.1 tRNA pseudouridine32 synthase / 23S rRNA pseudouridine746 synthase [Flavobacterium haoranii]